MAFFKPVNIADTSQQTAASQTASADKMLGVTAGNKSALGKEFNQNKHLEGRQAADFWQGSKQNLSGQRNVTNGANRGADMGQSFSVMRGAGDANSVNANTARNASAVAKSVQDYGFAQSVKTNANAMQQEKDIFAAQNQAELNNGTWNAVSEGINGAVSGYMAGNELFNKGGLDKITKGIGNKAKAFKEGFKGKSDLWSGLKDTAAWNKHLQGGGAEIFAPLRSSGGGR